MVLIHVEVVDPAVHGELMCVGRGSIPSACSVGGVGEQVCHEAVAACITFCACRWLLWLYCIIKELRYLMVRNSAVQGTRRKWPVYVSWKYL